METPSIDTSREIPLLEHFYSIQGEGFHQGKAAYFIRTAGCDVGCTWCDVKESWEVSAEQAVSISKLVATVKATNTPIAIITGGEPLIWNLDTLTETLQKTGIKTHIETSGAYPLSGQWDWICLSPKRFKLPLDEVLMQADELKVIVYHENDLRWAEKFIPKLKEACKLYLQPEWSKEKEMLPLIVEYIKKYPQWEISLQIHKYMNVP